LPHKTLVMAFVAFVGLGCAFGCVWNKLRKRKPDKKTLWEAKLVPLKYEEQAELDAEPQGRNWWTSIADNAARRTTNDPSGTSPPISSCPAVLAKVLMPAHPLVGVKSYPTAITDDEEEDEDSAEDLPVFHMFRIDTEGQHHPGQVNRERQIVPDGLECLCTWELDQIHHNPFTPRKVSLT